jgi:putative FmdB family regulatory protein
VPLYDYLCQACGRRFDALRRMSERTEAPPCPACASDETVLALSVPAPVGGGGAGNACSTGTWTGGG